MEGSGNGYQEAYREVKKGRKPIGGKENECTCAVTNCGNMGWSQGFPDARLYIFETRAESEPQKIAKALAALLRIKKLAFDIEREVFNENWKE